MLNAVFFLEKNSFYKQCGKPFVNRGNVDEHIVYEPVEEELTVSWRLYCQEVL